jgi:hypothetical protein
MEQRYPGTQRFAVDPGTPLTTTMGYSLCLAGSDLTLLHTVNDLVQVLPDWITHNPCGLVRSQIQENTKQKTGIWIEVKVIYT